MITAVAKQPGGLAAIGHALARALGWVWHSDLTVITAITRHQVPHPAQGAVFAVTFVLVIAIVFRRRKRPASG